MRVVVIALTVGVVGASLAARSLAAPSAQTATCRAKADREGLSGAARRGFESKCRAGALAPGRPTAPVGKTVSATAVVAPSGADRTKRSQQCNSEADRRGLKGGDYQAFRKSCVATAGPVTEGQTGTQTPKPAGRKGALDAAASGKPH